MTPFFNNTFPPEVVTFVSHRPDDFSLRTGQKDLTEEQKQFLSKELEFPLATAVNIRQVHGKKTIFVTKETEFTPPDILEEADGIFTDAVNLPILIRTADCIPIFVYDPQKVKIGLLHAGWKGTREGILPEGLRREHVLTEDVKIAFGPGIRECCYEVGGDVEEYFPADIVRKEGKCYLDLVRANIRQAVDLGVKRENITDCGVCTCCHRDYFSYRRDGIKAGRMISLMMLKK